MIYVDDGSINDGLPTQEDLQGIIVATALGGPHSLLFSSFSIFLLIILLSSLLLASRYSERADRLLRREQRHLLPERGRHYRVLALQSISFSLNYIIYMIRYTWMHFFYDTAHPEWLLRFPMVKSVVRAMYSFSLHHFPHSF